MCAVNILLFSLYHHHHHHHRYDHYIPVSEIGWRVAVPVLVTNLERDTAVLTDSLLRFSSVPPDKWWDTSIRPLLLTSKIVSILFILSCV
jgi:hypothetical protein